MNILSKKFLIWILSNFNFSAISISSHESKTKGFKSFGNFIGGTNHLLDAVAAIYTLQYLSKCTVIHIHIHKLCLTLSGFQFKNKSLYTSTIAPILYVIKYYFVFSASALNPFIYGYFNETMRKAFKITFPWLFKEKV